MSDWWPKYDGGKHWEDEGWFRSVVAAALVIPAIIFFAVVGLIIYGLIGWVVIPLAALLVLVWWANGHAPRQIA